MDLLAMAVLVLCKNLFIVNIKIEFTSHTQCFFFIFDIMYSSFVFRVKKKKDSTVNDYVKGTFFEFSCCKK